MTEPAPARTVGKSRLPPVPPVPFSRLSVPLPVLPARPAGEYTSLAQSRVVQLVENSSWIGLSPPPLR